MTPPKRRAEAFHDAMQKSREKAAEKVFEVGEVMRRAADMAARGYGGLRISPPHGVALDDTAAAKVCAEALAREGFKVAWEECAMLETDKENPTGLRQVARALIVRWR
jgi:hypothetical protein